MTEDTGAAGSFSNFTPNQLFLLEFYNGPGSQVSSRFLHQGRFSNFVSNFICTVVACVAAGCFKIRSSPSTYLFHRLISRWNNSCRRNKNVDHTLLEFYLVVLYRQEATYAPSPYRQDTDYARSLYSAKTPQTHGHPIRQDHMCMVALHRQDSTHHVHTPSIWVSKVRVLTFLMG